MKRTQAPLPFVVLLLSLGIVGPTTAFGADLPRPSQAKAPDPIEKVRLVESYGRMRLGFEANQGQTDPRVRFLARGGGYTIFLTGTEAVLALREQRPREPRAGFLPARFHEPESLARQAWQDLIPPRLRDLVAPSSETLVPADSANPEPRIPNPEHAESESVLVMKLVGGNAEARVVGLDELPGRSNYFIGNDPKKWRTNVPNYAKVKYQNVYPGVDLVYYGNQRQLEYDFVVAPGADPRAIVLDVGAVREPPQRAHRDAPLQIATNGDLIINTDGGEVRFHKPVVYQRPTANGERTAVDGRYTLTAGNQVGFQVGSYDKSRPLVIDPVLSYSSFLGGSGPDGGSSSFSIAVDAFGNAYAASGTASLDFPTTPGAFQRSFGGPPAPAICSGYYQCGDAFVSKINAAGSALVYSTYLGGSGDDYAYGLAVDSFGNAYVTGQTTSSDFPTTAGAFQTAIAGSANNFVTKLNPAGSALVYSTYLGGSGSDFPQELALDALGNAYVTGSTNSLDFPTTAGAFQTTFTNKPYCSGCSDVFVTKLNPTGTGLVYSTYLGGFGNDSGVGIAVDASRNAWVTGTTSWDFPTTAGAFQTNRNPSECGTPPSTYPCGDAFVTELNSAGSGLLYSTYLGGSGGEYALTVAVGPDGDAFVEGLTSSADFPTTAGAFQTTFGGPYIAGCDAWGPCNDAFVSKIDPTKSGPGSLVYSTYLGGSGSDEAFGIAVDSSGNAYVTGQTYSTDFPTVNPVQAANGGGWDAFVAKLNPTGTALVYSTFLGGSNHDLADFIAVDQRGNAYVGGWTESADFATTPGVFQPRFGGVRDIFVAKIAPINAPGVSLSTGTLIFGPQPVRTTSAPKTFILRNVGSAPMAVAAITTSASFAQTNTCGNSVPGAGNCTISVTFTPGTIGLINGTLTVNDNAVNARTPQTVQLLGFGIPKSR